MQNLREIRRLLDQAGASPNRRMGQNFLIEDKYMRKLLTLGDLAAGTTVLEVGAATGSLTEELLDAGCDVVAVEIDRRLAELLKERLCQWTNLKIIAGDVMAGKHAIAPAVLDALGERAHLVSNLPYNIATPLIAECLKISHRAVAHGACGACRFDRLTFTVQSEVSDRLTAGPGGGDYGPISVLISLLGKVTTGPTVPPGAFWPRPKVSSQILRIDLDADKAVMLRDVEALREVLNITFGQRRKQIGAILRRKRAPSAAPKILAAMESAGVPLDARAEQITPAQYLAVANKI